jgi:hypothetical protein
MFPLGIGVALGCGWAVLWFVYELIVLFEVEVLRYEHMGFSASQRLGGVQHLECDWRVYRGVQRGRDSWSRGEVRRIKKTASGGT